MRTRSAAAAIVAPCLTMLIGCSAGPGDVTEGSTSVGQELASCPTPTAQDGVFRATATLALSLMADEADACVPTGYSLAIMSVLAPQRYRIQSSGTGIEFDPNDRMYNAVTDPMKAHLAFAQLDSSVAQFLSDGLKYAYGTTNGTVFPRMRMAWGLYHYQYPNTTSGTLYDSTTPSPNADHHYAVSGSVWCGSSIVHLSDTVIQSWQYSPLDAQPITASIGGSGGPWYTSPPAAFKGTKSTPWTPFNGAVSTGNPYLVVTVNGNVTNWSNYNWGTVDCTKLPGGTCSGSVEIDPVPYAEPGSYYSNGALLGMQSNPFALDPSALYATPDHAGQWATRTVNGVQQWGTFSQAVTIYGMTEYKFVKQY